MEKQPLISVIIPVYNVEEFMDQCIRSVVEQTYKNLEIILVDDGSTDRSGSKCDEWAKKDLRIRVIHKENGGLSDARNAGMAVAKGDYIGFIDSDDYISEDMYEILLNLCIENDVPLSCIRYDTVGKGYNPPRENGIKEIVSAHKMLTMITWPWNYPDMYAAMNVMSRLYRRDILEGMSFPKGRVYEDITFSTEVLQKAEKIAYYNKALYHHRSREDSITGKDRSFSMKCFTDRTPQIEKQIKMLKSYGYNDLVVMCRYRAAMELYRLKYHCSDEEIRILIDKEIGKMKPPLTDILRYIPGMKSKLMTSVKTVFLGLYVKKKYK